jgi:patatin-related protein
MSSTEPIPMRQLRLALVCDGGVSLAVYMHGVTKELHKLVRASRACDAAYGSDPAGIAQAPNPFDPARDTEHAYFEELRDIAVAGRPVCVVIDIVSGTSAGGINGVCLAKVLATGGSQDRLRDLWMSKGDLRQLLAAPRMIGLRPQLAVAAVRMLGGVYPLHGDRMSRWLFDAITTMDGEPAASLVPEGNSLELFVTTTDLEGFDVLVPAGGGGASQHAVDHRQVLTFRYGRAGADDFTAADTGALAFAARATSAFPGAFPPVSVDSFAGELAGEAPARPVAPASVTDRLLWHHAGPERTRTAPCADGGVLDNQPFDVVIQAIARKRAETDVVRRLVYIEPIPGGALEAPTADPGPAKPQGLLQDLKAALITARAHQPVLRDLVHLRDLNLRIGQIGEIAAQHGDEVLAAITASTTGDLSALDRDGVRALAATMHDQAAGRLGGPSYGTYCRLKLGAAADEIADHVDVRFSYPPGSNRSSFARAVIHAWCHAQPGWRTAGNDALIRLLDGMDVPYRVRRLRFILAGVNDLYPAGRGAEPGTPTLAELNTLKAKAWDLLDQIHRQTVTTVADLPSDIAGFLDKTSLTDRCVLDEPGTFADEFNAEIAALVKTYGEGMAPTVAETQEQMWTVFREQTAGWAERHRNALLSRYVAFPLWDALIFPVIALAPVPQFTPIGVTRFSPRDAQRLDGVQHPKLRGVAAHHFAGFLEAGYRENDYLWGRLDGAELCLNTLRSGAYDRTSGTQGDHGPHLDRAIEAIVPAEGDLKTVRPLADRVLARLRTA